MTSEFKAMWGDHAVSFHLDDDDLKLPTKEIIAKIITPGMGLLIDKVLSRGVYGKETIEERWFKAYASVTEESAA